MSQIELSEVQPHQPRHRAVLAIVGTISVAAVLAVAVVGSGILRPASAPGDPPVAGAVPAQTASAPPTTTATPKVTATPSPTAGETRGGFSVTDLVGRWTGDVVVPWTGPNWESDPSKDTTWRLTMTIDECTRGASCGRWEFATKNLGGTGEPVTCKGMLVYTGLFEDRAAFAFSESVTSTVGVANCQAATLVLTPFSGGTRAAVEERQAGAAVSWGLVSRSTQP